MNFPSFPSLNQTYTYQGRTWKYNGVGWALEADPLPAATTSLAGIVQLNNTYTSTSTTQAPTANALKSAYDALNSAKAPLASPALTGNPTAPTPATGDNDTSIATTAFVKAQAYAPLASPTLTGTPTAPTPAALDDSAKLATTEFVKAQAYAPLASPALTGAPTAPTPVHTDDTTKIANTAYVTDALTRSDWYGGSWTPAMFQFTNLDADDMIWVGGHWHRIGNVVFFLGTLNLRPNVYNVTTEMSFGIPVARANFTAANQGRGIVVQRDPVTTYPAGYLEARVGTNRMTLVATSHGTAFRYYNFSGSYMLT